MNKTILNFDEIKVKKSALHKCKYFIAIKKVDIKNFKSKKVL